MRKAKKLWIYIIFALLIILVIGQKKNLFMDEIFSYGLSNHKYVDTYVMQPVEGETYVPAVSAYLDYVAVQPEHRFDYANVWKNQAEDVHPPLYYVLLHTICSFFPDNFSIWYAGIINILFALLTLWVVHKLIYELTGSEAVAMLGAVGIAISPGILSSLTFLRMYAMTMFWVTLITCIFVKAVGKELSWRFFLTAAGVTVLGALTHYYFIVYLFFASLFFGIYLLVKKQFIYAAKLIVTMGMSGVVSVGIFPSMIHHMFTEEGNRGEETIDNLTAISFSDYKNRVVRFVEIVSEELFGGLLIGVILLIVILMGVKGFGACKKTGMKHQLQSLYQKMKTDNVWKWTIVIGSIACYFLIVAKMAVYLINRYMFPIYALLVSAIFCMLYVAGKSLLSKKVHVWLMGMVMLLTVALGYKIHSWPYLYLETQQLLNEAAQHSEKNCIFFYDSAYRVQSAFYEVSNYKSVTFISHKNPELLNEVNVDAEDGLIVTMTNNCDFESIQSEIMKRYPNLSQYREMGGYDYSKSYHFY